jgi:hypothetical protein
MSTPTLATTGRAPRVPCANPDCRAASDPRALRRGLCDACRRRPDTLARFPRYHKPPAVADYNGPGVLPPPTDAEPGSPEKVAALELRAACRHRLFRPEERDGDYSPTLLEALGVEADEPGCLLTLDDQRRLRARKALLAARGAYDPALTGAHGGRPPARALAA